MRVKDQFYHPPICLSIHFCLSVYFSEAHFILVLRRKITFVHLEVVFASNTSHDLKHLSRDPDRDAALLRLGLWNGVPWAAAWNSPSCMPAMCRITEKWNFGTSQTSQGTGIEENISGCLYCLLVGWDCRKESRCARRSWGMFGCRTCRRAGRREVWTGCPGVAPI